MTTLAWVSLFTNQNILATDFITDFRTNIDEDTADFASDTQITNWIKDGLKNIEFWTNLYPEFAEATCDGSAYYTLPSDLRKMEEVEWIDSTGKHLPIVKATPVQAENMGFSTSIARYYTREGNRLYLFGTPSTGTIRVYGTRPPKIPANNSNYIDLLPAHEEVLKQWCTWKFWARRRELDEASTARQLYFDMLEKVKEDVDAELQHAMVMYGKKSQLN